MLPSPSRLIEQLLRLLWPPSGRHRRSATAPRPTPAPCTRPCPTPKFRPQPHTYLLRGEDNALVRPYLTAHNAHSTQVTA